MNKALALIPVVFAIFALILSPAVMSVSGEKGGNDNSQGTPQSCLKDTKKNPEKNPNCVLSDLTCDGDGNGVMTVQEILAYLIVNHVSIITEETLIDWIEDIERDEDPELNAEIGAIDNEIHELPELNEKLGDIATCSF